MIPRSMVRANTGALVALALSLAAASAWAGTLNEALATAYANNPTLQAARAQLRQVDEQVPQALANWRPTVDIEGNAGVAWEEDHVSGFGTSNNTREPKSAALNLTQPLYRGGRTVAQRGPERITGPARAAPS